MKYNRLIFNAFPINFLSLCSSSRALRSSGCVDSSPLEMNVTPTIGMFVKLRPTASLFDARHLHAIKNSEKKFLPSSRKRVARVFQRFAVFDVEHSRDLISIRVQWNLTHSLTYENASEMN
jgi:hypothetical protein